MEVALVSFSLPSKSLPYIGISSNPRGRKTSCLTGTIADTILGGFMTKTIDLLHGKIMRSLCILAVPIVMTYFIQMAYNFIDMIWIGRLGSGAVAGVGSAVSAVAAGGSGAAWAASTCGRTMQAVTHCRLLPAQNTGKGSSAPLCYSLD